MALSVAANNGGNGLANLFRQSRPVKLADEAGTATEQPTMAVSLRPLGRDGIDSTGSGTAQMSAALTQYLSKLGGSDEPASAAPAKSGTVTALTKSTPRSSAADALRVLDAYNADSQRLTA